MNNEYCNEKVDIPKYILQIYNFRTIYKDNRQQEEGRSEKERRID